MRTLLSDLQRAGLAGGAIVFTMAAFCAAVCGGTVFAALPGETSISREQANVGLGVFWLVCMFLTWCFLARARRSWPKSLSSTSLFHGFQVVSLSLCVGVGILSGGLQSETLLWCCFGLEVTVAIFYFCYVFLGVTFRYRMDRSEGMGFLVSLAALWWSSRHFPGQ